MEVKPAIEPITKIDVGLLLLETVRNSQHVTPRLQDVVAQYLEYQSKPVRLVQPIKVDL